MKTKLEMIAEELREYCPQADAYQGEHVHKGWADRIEQIIEEDRAQRQAEPVAWAVYWGIGQMRKNSVHFERATAEEFAGEIKSITEIRPLYAAPPPAQVPDFLFDGARFKLSFNGQGNCTTFRLMEHDLQGRWVALVDATDGRHLAAAPL